jgi:CRP-like cAMP-binding protein
MENYKDKHKAFSDAAGNTVHNEILLGLPSEERQTLFPRLEFVNLSASRVLHEPQETLQSAYFCNTGFVSLLTVFYNGKTVEAGLIGRDGFIGLPLVVGLRAASTRAVVRGDATAFRIDAQTLLSALKLCPKLERRLHQFSQLLAMQVTQIAACNRLHHIDGRLARWLLTSADKARSNSLSVTQDVLAQVLGTRRPSVTVASAKLERAGAIYQTRGHVKIINSPLLEKSACECYAAIQRQGKGQR